MLNKIKNASKKKKIIFSAAFLVSALVLIFFIFKSGNIILKPTLTLMPPAPLESSNHEEFIVDLELSKLPSNIYPAASISIKFDKNKLEFTGIKQGTMMVGGDEFTIPIWNCNTEKCNKDGEINSMYLDMTAGKNSYCVKGFDEEKKNIVVRLGFKLRDSAISGDVYNLTIKDAVFATIDGDKDKSSLSMKLDTLKTKSCKVAVK